MLSIALHGCSGHMGKVVARLVSEAADAEVSFGVDPAVSAEASFPVYASLSQAKEPYDVVIDFSTASAVNGLLEDCVAAGKPLVLCTTGLSDAQKELVGEASEKVPVFFSANMSLGVNLLTSLAEKAAKILNPAGFDVEIEERHHNRKLDAPSGTALMIGEALKEALGQEFYLDTGRMDRRAARDPHAIGMSALRGGTIVGEHTVLFAGHDELIELKHTALSRDIFGIGALNAARFLSGKPAGLYDMSDMLSEI